MSYHHDPVKRIDPNLAHKAFTGSFNYRHTAEFECDAASHDIISRQRLVVVVGEHGGLEDQTSNLPAIRVLRPVWNKGRIIDQKLSLKPKHVWATRMRPELAENDRYLALFNMAIVSKLPGCDLVRMKVVDVMASGQIKKRASVLQSKTQSGLHQDFRRDSAIGLKVDGRSADGWV